MKFLPMLASVGSKDDLERKDLIFEPKLDGYRALVHVDKEITLLSRNDHDITPQFPEFAHIKDAINAKECLLDAELICYDVDGNPNFQMIQGRSQLGSKMIISSRSQDHPATLIVFDILSYNGKSVMDKPLLERKKLLDKVVKDAERIVKVPYTTDGKKMWKEMFKRKAEGVIAKEADGLYYPGKRKDTWLKIKQFETADCVVIGYTQEKRLISALALAMYDKKGELVYVGNIGSGFTEADQKDLYKKLQPTQVKEKPVPDAKSPGVKWVKPFFVIEATYLELTKDKKLRHATFLRLRTDKTPEECTMYTLPKVKA